MPPLLESISPKQNRPSSKRHFFKSEIEAPTETAISRNASLSKLKMSAPVPEERRSMIQQMLGDTVMADRLQDAYEDLDRSMALEIEDEEGKELI